MANNKFKSAVKRAKGLYKTGRYKSFADAVKAAYHKTGGKRGSHKRKPRRISAPGKKRVGSGAKRKSASPVQRIKHHIELSLGKAYVDHYKAKTIKATKSAGRRIKSLKTKLRSFL